METITTDVKEPEERLSYWRDVVGNFFSEIEFYSSEPEKFAAQMHAGNATPVKTFRFESTSHSVRNPAQDATGLHLLRIERGEFSTSQNGNSHVLRPGDFAIFDRNQEFEIDVPEYAKATIVSMPGNLSPRDLVHPLEIAGLPINGSTGIGAVTSDFILAFARQMENLDESEFNRIFACLIDLLNTAALSFKGKTYWPRSRHQAFQIQKIRIYIESQLKDPELSAQSIAEEHGISCRYLARLFEDQGITVSKLIWQRRLEQCHKALLDRAIVHEPITAIAFSWGFSSASHFSRAFKSRFGISPTELRRNALQDC